MQAEWAEKFGIGNAEAKMLPELSALRKQGKSFRGKRWEGGRDMQRDMRDDDEEGEVNLEK